MSGRGSVELVRLPKKGGAVAGGAGAVIKERRASSRMKNWFGRGSFSPSSDEESSGKKRSSSVVEVSKWTNGKDDSGNGTDRTDNAKENEGPPPVPFFQLFRYSTACEKILLVFGAISGFVMGFAFPAIIILFGEITQEFVIYGGQLAVNGSSAGISDKFIDAANTFAISMSGLALIQVVFDYIFVVTYTYTAEKQIFRIRNSFLKAMLRQDVGWYDTHATNDFCSRVAEDLNKLQEGIGDKVPICIMSVSNFFICLGVAFYYGWKLTLVILSVMPIMGIAGGLVAKVQTTFTEKELQAYSVAGSVAEEVLGSVRTVAAFGGQKKEMDRYKTSLTLAEKAVARKAMIAGIGAGLSWFMIYASYSLAFWYGITLILEEPENYQVASLTIIFFCLMLGSMSIGMSSTYFEAFGAAKGAAGKIYDVLERVPPIDSESRSGLTPDKFHGVIEFCDVYFNYPSRPDVKILEGFNLTVNPGETVALVGNSGCGKSTVLQLLQRFYDPTQGMIKVDGIDIKELNIRWLRSHLGLVGQEPVLFATTIGKNICFGKPDINRTDMELAAKQANAHDFITKLPLQYDTMVGERGAQLSGGQKQRVAIARSLVRDPKVLLLDEATSALDVRSESVVQKALDAAKEGRTTFVVAHRLSTIQTADRIVVLSNGRAHEEGSHRELMRLKGLYYLLVTAQIPSGLEDEMLEEEGQDKPRLERLMSHLSTTSTIEPDDEAAVIVASGKEKEEMPPLSLLRILKANLPEWPYVLVGCISAGIQGASMPVYAVLFGEIIGSLAAVSEEETKKQRDMYSIAFLVLGVVAGFAVFLQGYMFSISGDKLTSRLRVQLFSNMLKQEMGWFDESTNSTGALCSRLSSDASSVQGATGSRLGTLVQAFFALVLAVSMALYMEWKLGLTVLAFVPWVVGGTGFESKMMMGQGMSEKKALEEASKIALEAITNIRTVASLCLEDTFQELYVAELIGPHVKAIRNGHIRGVVYGLSKSSSNFAYAAVMLYGAHIVVDEGLDFRRVFQIGEALVGGSWVVGQAFAFAPNYNKGRLSAARIFQMLERKPKIDDSDDVGNQLVIQKGRIKLQDVDFHYPTRTQAHILKSINLDVPQGYTVALVGPSGCGKSTCLQLLLRFYDPITGKVMVDENDTVTLNVKGLRSQLGLVSQEPVLFDRTISDNIAYGDNTRNVTIQEVMEASRQANIHNFIASLPQGYETRVGSRGTQLSGGQKQRVAIARALVRNPKVLLLDEATSALDTESEKVVQEALDKAQVGRTCIVIAHRLSTIRNADLIVVIDHGQVVEVGTHSELLSKGGLYYKLCRMQETLH